MPMKNLTGIDLYEELEHKRSRQFRTGCAVLWVKKTRFSPSCAAPQLLSALFVHCYTVKLHKTQTDLQKPTCLYL